MNSKTVFLVGLFMMVGIVAGSAFAQRLDNRAGPNFDPATAVAWIDLVLSPKRREATIVRMALDQIFGNQHRGSAQHAIALANE